ncbi:DUF3307 domain-containing protein [Tetragenococcus solitarius]|uniref:DUF3307 domain-containing protein n=1 Tax=Tetragenococcus solitarius TaxID=71453 RepID=A0ABN3Y024_9ENTE|nr:DUF3307 domain-containing protein [Tetragenococcus solitarius]
MTQILLLHFFIGHILADYYFQTATMAKEKEYSFKYLALHCLIYFFTMLAMILPLFHWQLFLWATLIAVIHFMIDFGKTFIQRRFRLSDLQSVLFYLVDQLLHIFTILFVVACIVWKHVDLAYFPFFVQLASIFHIHFVRVLSWVMMLLLIIKPSSITIRKVLDPFNPKIADDGFTNAGALIGVLERLIILFMLYAGQYAAIGFVLTAKSIARYNKIAEEPKFAEYYLLGTLLSSLLVIISFQIVF